MLEVNFFFYFSFIFLAYRNIYDNEINFLDINYNEINGKIFNLNCGIDMKFNLKANLIDVKLYIYKFLYQLLFNLILLFLFLSLNN